MEAYRIDANRHQQSNKKASSEELALDRYAQCWLRWRTAGLGSLSVMLDLLFYESLQYLKSQLLVG